MKPTDPNHTPKRWLRNTVDGTIYEWNQRLSEHPKCVEISDALLFPQAYVQAPSQAPEPTEEVKKRGRPKKDLNVEEMEAAVTQPPFTTTDFSADVGRGWPK